MDKIDKRTKIYKDMKKQQEIQELDKLEKENKQLEEIEINLRPQRPTDRELEWLKKLEKSRMTTGPYPTPFEMRQRKELLHRIEYYNKEL